jgi:hypothetical protein
LFFYLTDSSTPIRMIIPRHPQKFYHYIAAIYGAQRFSLSMQLKRARKAPKPNL